MPLVSHESPESGRVKVTRELIQRHLGVPVEAELTSYAVLRLPRGVKDPETVQKAATAQLKNLEKVDDAEVKRQLTNIVNQALSLILDIKKAAEAPAPKPAAEIATDTQRSVATVVPSAVVAPVAPAAPADDSRDMEEVPNVFQTAQQHWKTITGLSAAAVLGIAALVASANRENSTAEKIGPVVAAVEPKQPETVTPIPTAVPKAVPSPSISVDDPFAEQQENVIITGNPVVGSAFPSASAFPSTVAPAQVSVETAKPQSAPVPVRAPMEFVAADASTSTAPDAVAPKPALDTQKVKSFRDSLRTASKNKVGAAKIDEILSFANDPEMRKTPEAMRAVYEEAFDAAVQVKDARRARSIQKTMAASPTLFVQDEVAAYLDKVTDTYAKASALPEMRKPERTMDRQELARDLLELAREMAEIDPTKAVKVLSQAKTALGAQPKDTRSAFEKRVDDAKESIEADQELARLSGLLEKNPRDVDAHAKIGTLHLQLGNPMEALDHLAESNHPKADLAKKTKAVLMDRRNASGKVALDLAKEWEKLAAMTSNGKQESLRRIAVSAYTAAIEATTDGLNPIEKKIAVDERTALAVASAVSAEKVAEKAESIDLMKDIDLKKSVISGPWKRNPNGSIESGFDPNPRLEIVKLIGENFDVTFEFEFTRPSGYDSIDFVLPLGKDGADLVFNTWYTEGGSTGFNGDNGVDARKNPNSTKGIVVGGGLNKVTLHVHSEDGKALVEATIENVVDKKTARYSWKGDTKALSISEAWKGPKGSVMIGNHKSTVVWHAIRMQLHAGTMEKNGMSTTVKKKR